MKLSNIVIAALSLSAATAFAESPDVAGQFAVAAPAARSQAQASQQVRFTGVSPWSTSFNPLTGFQSKRSRAEVTAEYVRSREAVQAFTGEDSGSAFLATAPRHAGAAVSAD